MGKAAMETVKDVGKKAVDIGKKAVGKAMSVGKDAAAAVGDTASKLWGGVKGLFGGDDDNKAVSSVSNTKTKTDKKEDPYLEKLEENNLLLREFIGLMKNGGVAINLDGKKVSRAIAGSVRR